MCTQILSSSPLSSAHPLQVAAVQKELGAYKVRAAAMLKQKQEELASVNNAQALAEKDEEIQVHTGH